MIYLGFSLLFQLLQRLSLQSLAASPPSNLFKPLINVCLSCRPPCAPPSGLLCLFALAQQLLPFQVQKESIMGLYTDLFFSTRRTLKGKGGNIHVFSGTFARAEVSDDHKEHKHLPTTLSSCVFAAVTCSWWARGNSRAEE